MIIDFGMIMISEEKEFKITKGTFQGLPPQHVCPTIKPLLPRVEVEKYGLYMAFALNINKVFRETYTTI